MNTLELIPPHGEFRKLRSGGFTERMYNARKSYRNNR